MRKTLLAYLLSGATCLTLYGVGGFTGWWRGIVRWAGASSAFGGRGSGGGSSGWSGGGGGFRGGK